MVELFLKKYNITFKIERNPRMYVYSIQYRTVCNYVEYVSIKNKCSIKWKKMFENKYSICINSIVFEYFYSSNLT